MTISTDRALKLLDTALVISVEFPGIAMDLLPDGVLRAYLPCCIHPTSDHDADFGCYYPCPCNGDGTGTADALGLVATGRMYGGPVIHPDQGQLFARSIGA